MPTMKAPFYKKIKKEKVHQDILEVLPLFDSLPKDKKDFLIKLYLKSYEYGTRVVKNDAFTNPKSITFQDLHDRFEQYPDVKDQNLAFVKKVAEEDNTAIDSILEKSANQENFVYEVYESTYIDKSIDVLHTMVIPKGYEEIDISLISQDGYADGAMTKLDYLAKNTLSQLAADLIGEM